MEEVQLNIPAISGLGPMVAFGLTVGVFYWWLDTEFVVGMLPILFVQLLKEFDAKFIQVVWSGKSIVLRSWVPWRMFSAPRELDFLKPTIRLAGDDATGYHGDIQWKELRTLKGNIEAYSEYEKSFKNVVFYRLVPTLLWLSPIAVMVYGFGFDLEGPNASLIVGATLAAIWLFWPYKSLVKTTEGIRDLREFSFMTKPNVDFQWLKTQGLNVEFSSFEED